MSIRYYHRGLIVLLSIATLGIILIALAYLSSSDIDTKWMKDIIIPLSLALIALAALGIAVWQGFETRRYFQISVKPYIEVDYVTVPDEPVKIVLRNKGVGPAIITNMTLKVDDKTFDAHSISNLRACFATAAASSGLSARILDSGRITMEIPKEEETSGQVEFYCRWVMFSTGDAISPDEDRILLSISMDKIKNGDIQKLIHGIIIRIAVVIEYRSIYDIKFETHGASVRIGAR